MSGAKHLTRITRYDNDDRAGLSHQQRALLGSCLREPAGVYTGAGRTRGQLQQERTARSLLERGLVEWHTTMAKWPGANRYVPLARVTVHLTEAGRAVVEQDAVADQAGVIGAAGDADDEGTRR